MSQGNRKTEKKSKSFSGKTSSTKIKGDAERGGRGGERTPSGNKGKRVRLTSHQGETTWTSHT